MRVILAAFLSFIFLVGLTAAEECFFGAAIVDAHCIKPLPDEAGSTADECLPPTRKAPGHGWEPDMRSVLQLHNPADSPVKLVVYGYGAAWAAFGFVDDDGEWQGYQRLQRAVGVDLRFHDAPLEQFIRHGRGVETHGASIAEFRGEVFEGVRIPAAGNLFLELWLGAPRETRSFEFPRPIVLAPGESIISAPDQPIVYNIGNFEWCEVPL